MALPSTTDLRTALQALESRVSLSALLDPIRGAAFWSAVALPFLYLPLLTTGLDSRETTLAFVTLLGLNVLTLLVGHRYHLD